MFVRVVSNGGLFFGRLGDRSSIRGRSWLACGNPDNGGGRDPIDDDSTLLEPFLHGLGHGATGQEDGQDD